MTDISQSDESQYLNESFQERKEDLIKEDLSRDDSLFINWHKDIKIPASTPSLSDDIWSIIRGFRNGAVYGVKIRLPHALVMTLLFSNDRSIEGMSSVIFQKTKNHSLNLGKFVLLYKFLIVLIRRILKYPHNHFPLIHILGNCVHLI